MKTVLIANRGEIAVRIIRACADAGYRSVAVYADQDADALHVRLADEAYALAGTTPADTYLDMTKLLDAAARAQADAVHPGYGFLSERAEFARAVTAAGLTWIGPTAASIEVLGDKVKARDLAREVGAPLVPGSDGPVATGLEAVRFAEEHGLPIAIKAAHGGGGRGMRVARAIDEIEDAFNAATREAEAAFGRGECFVERFLDAPRHVEVQVLADAHGNVLVVGDRDCTLQRRNQKLVEEAPAPFLGDDERAELHDAARRICARAGYRGAGTVEFLRGTDGTISFLEVNTRLQVEHPITEETSGVDLVLEQFRIAEGLPLTTTVTPEPHGHAIEFRINAEDPGRGFLPTPGQITTLRAPGGPGVRVDTGAETGDAVQAAFDSLIAKLIVWGPDRATAIARGRRALAELRIDGPATVIPFHERVLDHEDFAGDDFGVHTRWIETVLAPSLPTAPRGQAPATGEVVRAEIEIDGRRVRLGLPPALLGLLAVAAPGTGEATSGDDDAGAPDESALLAPVAGALSAWSVEDGATVTAGQRVATMVAMKMEAEVLAHRDGTLHYGAAAGDSVVADAVLGTIDA